MTGAKTDNNGNVKPSVTFHTVLDRPVQAGSGSNKETTTTSSQTQGGTKYKKSGGSGQSWRNIFHLGEKPLSRSRQGQELRGSHREINIDEAILPENKPLNYRPRPRSEINLSYSIQVGSVARMLKLVDKLSNIHLGGVKKVAIISGVNFRYNYPILMIMNRIINLNHPPLKITGII